MSELRANKSYSDVVCMCVCVCGACVCDKQIDYHDLLPP